MISISIHEQGDSCPDLMMVQNSGNSEGLILSVDFGPAFSPLDAMRGDVIFNV
tara:strand:+ start:441 stop:599 length:159 start_codon:yes stop_codon:yes gene_type:complete